MSRRRRRSREVFALEALVPLFGLLTFLWAFSPQFRSLIVTLAILVVAVAIICLAAIFIVLPVTEKIASSWLKERPIIPESKPTEPPQQVTFVHTVPLILPQLKPIDPLLYKYIHKPEPEYLYKPTPVTPPPPRKFTAALLSALEWRRFEILVMLYFQNTHRDAKRSRAGADGGVDILIFQPGQTQPQACVQCKAWNTYDVGVKPVRELYGVMAGDNIPKGYFITTGNFTKEASTFAQGKALVLIDGRQFLDALNSLPGLDREAILSEVTSGDYTTPTCPRCDVKMVQREGSKGAFWGCRSYPRCRQTFKMSEQDVDEAV